MTPNRERMFVGLFLVTAVAVLSGTAIAVWGGLGGSGVSHRAYLKFSGGIQPGTAVRYGGMKAGAVRSVRVDPEDSTRIEVDFVVDAGTPVKTDSVARLASLGLLSDSYLEISTGTEGAALLPAGSVVESAESVGLAQMGDTIQSLVPQVQDALGKLSLNLDSLQTTLSLANDLLNDRNRENVAQALGRANDLLSDTNRSNLSASLDNLNQLLADARPKMSSGLANINDAAARLGPVLDEVQMASARADQLLANLDSILAENRPDLKASVSELRTLLSDSASAVDQLQGIMNENTANIQEMIEDMRASAANLRSLAETIRSSPSSLIRGVNLPDRKPGGIQ
jgi:phospholipid/cholesterol/gamma-HCH transport system substrate-binding protein